MGFHRKDVLCPDCLAVARGKRALGKPGCFTDEEWEGDARMGLPPLKNDYKDLSPCAECELSYRFGQMREGRCDLFFFTTGPDGLPTVAQFVSKETLDEIMATPKERDEQ